MDFEKFMQLEEKYLNLGALKNTHPDKNYLNYIGINPPGRFQNKVVDLETGKVINHPDYHPQNDATKDITKYEDKIAKHEAVIKSGGGSSGITAHMKEIVKYKDEITKCKKLAPKSITPYSIFHDIETPFPLPDNCVDRIHSEDCFEHIEETQYPHILNEIYRILKPGGLFRLAVPDYMNPKDRFCLEKGFDTRNNLHLTLTTYKLLKPYLDKSPFHVNYLHYWKDNDTFLSNKIDYSKGYIRRTPDNDERNKNGNPLYVTSFVADLIKPF